MFLLAAFVGLALSDATCSNPRIDDTLTPGATGKDIAHATYSKVWRKISEIDETIFQDREFLIRYALASTNYGENSTRGQIWEINQTNFDRTKTYFPESFHKTAILNKFHLDWNQVEYEDLQVPQYSLIALVLFLDSQNFFPAPFAQADQGNTFNSITNSQIINFTDAVARIESEVDQSCIDQELDLVILVDESGSVSSHSFEIVKDFILHLTGCLTFSEERARVAVVTYSSGVTIDFQLNGYRNRNFTDIISNLLYHGGYTTYTHMGLDAALGVFESNSASHRSKTKSVLLTITDGMSADRQLTLEAAERIKNDQRNIQSIAIGVGGYVEEELQGIASSPEHIHRLTGFNDFAEIKSMIMNTACNGDIDVRDSTKSGFTRNTDDVRASESINLILNGTDRFQLYSSEPVTVYGSYEYAKPSSISHDFTFDFLNENGLPRDLAWVEYNPEFNGKLFLTLETQNQPTPDAFFEIQIVKDPPANNISTALPIGECVTNAFCNMEAECECFNGYESIEDRWGDFTGSGDDYACVVPCPKTLQDSEIICEANRKVVKIPLCAVRDNHIELDHLFMGNGKCTGTVNEADGTIDFEHGVNGCFMQEWVNATHINFSGLIYSQQGGYPGSVISYGHGLELHHTCSFPKCLHIDLHIDVNIAVLTVDLGATGEFKTSVAVFDEPEMTSPVSVNKIFNGFDDVFVKIELNETNDFLLSFKECEAYDDSIVSRPTWPLITDGSSDGAEILHNYDNSISFNFKAFAFQDFNLNGPPEFGEEIKIQCTVCVCDPNLDQNCIPGARRRRSVGDESNEFVVNSTFKLFKNWPI